MTTAWLLTQIIALRDFAQLNGLPKLAEQLEEARLLALIEMAQAPAHEAAEGEAAEASDTEAKAN